MNRNQEISLRESRPDCFDEKGFIVKCPNCGSKNLKDESGFLIEGVSCKDCAWADIDGGIDSGC